MVIEAFQPHRSLYQSEEDRCKFAVNMALCKSRRGDDPGGNRGECREERKGSSEVNTGVL